MALERFAAYVSGIAASLTSLLKTSQAAARADDYLLAELLKLAPFDGTNYARVVLPYQENGGASPTNLPLLSIAAGGGTTIQVRPFRAIIGTRVAVNGTPATAPAEFLFSTAAEQSYRDIRSAVLCQNLGADGRGGFAIPSIQFASNSSGHPRIDLIYATLYLEQLSSTATLLVKPPTGGGAAARSIAPSVLTSVGNPAGAANAIGVVTGTPALVPTLPATPSDNAAGGQFVFPLGYVLVPDGFVTGSTALLAHNVCTVAQAGALAPAMGTPRIRPLANLAGANGLVNLTSNWRTAFARPGWTVPTTMVGGEIGWCLFDASLSAISAPFGDAAILDATIDWRNRYFVAVIYCPQAVGQKFASDPAAGSAPFSPCGGLSGSGVSIITCGGQSFKDDSLSTLSSSRNGGVVWWASPATLSGLASSSAVGMYVDLATGALKAYYFGTPAQHLFVWLFATAPYDNA